MADLIDRAALLEDVAAAEANSGMGYLVASTLRRYVKRRPAVDAVEVVRCKDCRHMERSARFRHCRVWGAINGMGDEGFCNYGERRADA